MSSGFNHIAVWAHRGFSAAYPENTRLAFEKALEYHSDGIECDIQKTKDNQFVILHDANLNRLTGCDAQISELNLNEVKKLDFGQGQKILTLEELLTFYPANKSLNLELKTETITLDDYQIIQQFLDVRRHEIDFLISSFNWSLLPVYKKHDYKVGLLFGGEVFSNISKAFVQILRIQPYSLNIPMQAFNLFYPFKINAVLQLLKILPFKYIFWNVNSTADYQKVKFLANAIITDKPDLFT